MFYDDIFIIAPQIIAIYDDWLHIDLFTVTEKTFQEKDYFTVLYDPEGVMKTFEKTQNLTLSEEEYKDHVLDVAWFLFQYKKAAERGNPTANLLDEEIEWIQQGFSEDHQTIRLLTLMIETYKGEKRHVEE